MGSSPAYSKLRPLRGSRVMIDAAADGHVVALVAQFAADDRAVEIRRLGIPTGRRAERGGQQRGVAALHGRHADADGRIGHVDVGMPSRSMPGMKPAPSFEPGGIGAPGRSAPQPVPCTSWIFSSRVICAMTMSARWSGGSALSIQGPCTLGFGAGCARSSAGMASKKASWRGSGCRIGKPIIIGSEIPPDCGNLWIAAVPLEAA